MAPETGRAGDVEFRLRLAWPHPLGEDPIVPLFIHTSTMPAAAERLAAWHLAPGALERLIPPWMSATIVSPVGVVEGARTRVDLRWGLLRQRWEMIHRDVLPNERFADELERGPLRRWRHVHRFLPESARKSRLEDHVEYELSGGRLGAAMLGRTARAQIRRAFDFRHRRTAHDLVRHGECPTAEPLRIAVSGASGLVGRALVPFLTSGGHQVRRLVRGAAEVRRDRAGESGGGAEGRAAPRDRPARSRWDVPWDPARGEIDAMGLEGLDAVVHLSGAPIFGGRWTPERRRILRESRVDTSRLLSKTLASLTAPPRVLICASAVGWYGDRGAREVDERSERGGGFLPDLCLEWERSTEEAENAGIRVVHLRLGVVLSGRGGALHALARLFRLGGGGRLGSGRQGMSWIALDDLLASILFAIVTPSIHGPVNATAPAPCSNREFTAMLARVLRRPAIVPAPAFAIRTLLGQMGEELMLAGAFVKPSRLLEHRFRFDFPTLEPTLRFELGRLTD